jgi:hypothetical protein
MTNCFKPYLHVERLSKTEVAGILNGTVRLTTKLDGTNASVWADEDGRMHYGSRKREISVEDDNAGFAAWMKSDDDESILLIRFCQANPNFIVYGEWGVGKVGAIKKYTKEAKNRLWIFDIYNRETERYLTWDELEATLIMYDLIDYRVKLLATLTNPTLDDIIKVASENTFLLEGADTLGEGVVIRRDNYVNPYGRYAVAKFVREDFRPDTPKVKRTIQAGEVEQDFINRYLTQSELEKAKAKTALACGEEYVPGNGKFIGMFLNLLWKDTLEENIIDFCKRAKNPQIDFAALNGLIKAEGRKFLGLI